MASVPQAPPPVPLHFVAGEHSAPRIRSKLLFDTSVGNNPEPGCRRGVSSAACTLHRKARLIMSRSHFTLALTGALAALVVAPHAAHGQASDADRARARTLAIEGHD